MNIPALLVRLFNSYTQLVDDFVSWLEGKIYPIVCMVVRKPWPDGKAMVLIPGANDTLDCIYNQLDLYNLKSHVLIHDPRPGDIWKTIIAGDEPDVLVLLLYKSIRSQVLSEIKVLVTSDKLHIGGEVYSNLPKVVIVCDDADHGVQLDEDDRRFFVVDLSTKYI